VAFFALPSGVFGAPFASFRNYDALAQACCGQLADDAPTGYRVWYDEFFRVIRVLRHKDGREEERWESVYGGGGVWRRTEHRSGQRILDLAEYGNHGRLIRFTRYQGTAGAHELEEYVYNQSGRLMLVKVFRGGALERICEARYHPSGFPFMNLIWNSGNAVIGRTVFETDAQGRVLRERSFLWGRLARITEYSYCEHGFVSSREERAPKAHENTLDPFYAPQGGVANTM